MLRARYSAMALGYAFYLKASSHPDNPALKGSDTDPSTGVKRHCTFEVRKREGKWGRVMQKGGSWRAVVLRSATEITS